MPVPTKLRKTINFPVKILAAVEAHQARLTKAEGYPVTFRAALLDLVRLGLVKRGKR